MNNLINRIKRKSKFVVFPIKIKSERTGLLYNISKIDNDMIYAKQICSTKEIERSAVLTNWTRSFLLQLEKLLDDSIEKDIWYD